MDSPISHQNSTPPQLRMAPLDQPLPSRYHGRTFFAVGFTVGFN